MSEKKTIGIIGAGGVGLTCVLFMADTSNVIVKTRRQEQANELNEKGVTAERGDQKEQTANFTATSIYEDLSECDSIIVTVKSYDSEQVAKELAPHIKDETEIVSIQNGIEAYEVLRQNIPSPERVFDGLTYVGANRTNDTTIILGDWIKTVVDQNAKVTCEALNISKYDLVASANVKKAVWEKLLLNLVSNATSAITGFNIKQMAQSTYCMELFKSLLREYEAVASAEGIKFDYDLFEKVSSSATSTHTPSMRQDIEAGKKTEIDAMNGAIVELGKQHDIATPYNEAITLLVKAIDPNYEIRI